MSYKYFKSKVHSMIIDGKFMGEQTINDLYTDYKTTPMNYTCAEWIEFWFADWKMETHGFELRKRHLK